MSRVCLECGTTSTCLWRYGPSGSKNYCNACGIRYARSLKKGNTTRKYVKRAVKKRVHIPVSPYIFPETEVKLDIMPQEGIDSSTEYLEDEEQITEGYIHINKPTDMAGSSSYTPTVDHTIASSAVEVQECTRSVSNVNRLAARGIICRSNDDIPVYMLLLSVWKDEKRV